MSNSSALGLDSKNSLSEVFHENTKLGPLSARAYSTWIFNFTRSRTAQETMHGGYKIYTLMERQELPCVESRSELERTIAARRSIRAFSGAAMDPRVDAAVALPTAEPRARALRAIASVGSIRWAYVAALVHGLDPGIYHYGVESHHLDVVKPGACLEALKDVVTWQGVDIDRAAAAIVITAAFRRSTVKYLDRGYRMVLMEAGEAAQNFCLLATDMGLGACLLGGFNDDLLSDLLDIDGVDEAPLLPVLVGRPTTPGVGGSNDR